MRELDTLLSRYQRQFRVASLGAALAIAGASGTVAAVVAAIAGGSATAVRAAGMATAAVLGVTVAAAWWRMWTLVRVAKAIEARCSGLENLIITAEERLAGRGRPLHPIIEIELASQAVERLRRARPADVVRPARAFTIAITVLAGFALMLITLPSGTVRPGTGRLYAVPSTAEPELQPGDLRVIVTPPAYARRPAETTINPATVVALEGSRVRLETTSPANGVRLIDTQLNAVSFVKNDNHFVYEFVASQTRALIVQYGDAPEGDRLVQLRVDSDRRPAVRMLEPAKDLMFPAPVGRVPIEIEATDDVGLKSLVLRYTRVAGSGESFTFEEGELPMTISTSSATAWRGTGVLALDALKLEDGDTLVYRAVVTDHKPGADPTSSDTFLIEVGRLAGVASTGFALPDDRERQAISQQMLIIKTERLHNERGNMSSDAFAEQSRLLAIEQRMVKAEFVFMTGGEVADEVAEAEHAHELAEGRLENTGQVELLTAIREMSRAEARLNDADTTRGLEFERAALKALQRAFDRRRYLLRTLPERSRIDATRRLTGELTTARSSARVSEPAVEDASVSRARAALRALAAVSTRSAEPPSIVASRIMAVDPASERLQQLAFALSTARNESERRTAAEAAQTAVLETMKARLGRANGSRFAVEPVLGRLSEELSRPRGRQ